MLDVITFGTATRDAFVKSEGFSVEEISRFTTGKGLCMPLGAKLDVEDMFFTTGGGATNTAVTFARQGLDAACVCKVGNDVSGREVIANLQNERVDTELIVMSEGEKTAYSVLILSQEGERTILVYRGVSDNILIDEVNWQPIEAKWFFLNGALPMDFVSHTIKLARITGANVAFNPSAKHIVKDLPKLKETLDSVDILITNREEASKITGISYDDEKGIFKKMDEEVKGIAVMTQGPKGLLVSDGKKLYRAGIFKEKEVADRTGAGDAFGSGFVAGLMDVDSISHVSEEKMEYAIKLGSANATSVVEHLGAKTGILTRESFETNSRWQGLDISVEDL